MTLRMGTLGIGTLLIGGALIGLPVAAQAQAYKCAVPGMVPDPRPDLASAKEPQRVLPIGGYTLAITWAPQYCRDNGREPSARFQCGSGNRFGFTLHGLWPDGLGKTWPQYCTATAIVPRPVIRSTLCSTPSAQLIQHEWAKHGTCMGTTPAAYFGQSTKLFGGLRYPDMDRLSRRPLTVSRFAAALAAANPGLPASAIRVTGKRGGWLDEVWLCLDKRFRYERCKAGSGGLSSRTTLKIWRGSR
ncbi:ribonuclease T2 family protein [Sphingomonas sp.]|uniref:ribonuclease T2 family protein n=1 Tax=Sphingomonas sp. TaxID=28214 RepID=UPI003D6D95BF